MAFGEFTFEHTQHFVQLGSHPGPFFLRRLRTLGGLLSRRHHIHAASGPQFVGPHGHGGQRRLRIGIGGNGLSQRGLERIPHQLQLAARGLQHGRELGLHTRPLRIVLQRAGLQQPVSHIGAQGVGAVLGIAPGLGRQHLDALRDQHRGFALHLHPVLQVFDGLDPLGQCLLQRGQRFARQRRPGPGGIALPGQGIRQVQP